MQLREQASRFVDLKSTLARAAEEKKTLAKDLDTHRKDLPGRRQWLEDDPGSKSRRFRTRLSSTPSSGLSKRRGTIELRGHLARESQDLPWWQPSRLAGLGDGDGLTCAGRHRQGDGPWRCHPENAASPDPLTH